MMFVASSPTPLEISLSAPLRRISTLFGEPAETSVMRKPSASANAAIRMAIVRPMPSAVVNVPTGRRRTLRTL